MTHLMFTLLLLYICVNCGPSKKPDLVLKLRLSGVKPSTKTVLFCTNALYSKYMFKAI